ncbi:hypothetical protein UFOVP1037_26 [uncultured Caudovirales phage]|uniref:Uncharacterized protein n=1 Tax=uncultured Caudovirales phage TaxID=2100421 RepID=A0A6J5LR76_9CAUD|nr:hypothetical protein UFOVP287_31 [uncultured Caudovirales phage]CAB4174001.1 hypothetical protein UFOVP969_21 [uncultured Caudovirales phage]CAB4180439.1 hypothetical protein UFOVP1037_26 [uncultured Caudovirales phage]CAB4194010.1 hypothetical protein UFOVP1250_28 [uncultured Caudovirales phage]
MTEQHILNELYKAQADLEKAQSIIHAYQDVIRSAQHLVDIINIQSNNATISTGGGTFSLAYSDLRSALHSVFDPNGDAR